MFFCQLCPLFSGRSKVTKLTNQFWETEEYMIIFLPTVRISGRKKKGQIKIKDVRGSLWRLFGSWNSLDKKCVSYCVVKNGGVLCVSMSALTLIGSHIRNSHHHGERLSVPHPCGAARATAVKQQRLHWQISTSCKGRTIHFVYRSPSARSPKMFADVGLHYRCRVFRSCGWYLHISCEIYSRLSLKW